MSNRWCEHDEVAVECLQCKLRLAEATTELLTIRLQRTLEAIEQAVEELERSTVARTHYEGCEADHPLCKFRRRVRLLVQGEDTCDGSGTSP